FLGPLQHADQSAHLGERLPARLLDDQQRVAFALLVGPEQSPYAGSLDGHDADAMADDVMQLARDPRPLLRDRGTRTVLALALGPGGASLRLPVLRQLRAERVPSEPDD